MVNYTGLMVKLSATCSYITPLRISWLNFPFHKSFDNMQNKKMEGIRKFVRHISNRQSGLLAEEQFLIR